MAVLLKHGMLGRDISHCRALCSLKRSCSLPSVPCAGNTFGLQIPQEVATELGYADEVGGQLNLQLDDFHSCSAAQECWRPTPTMPCNLTDPAH